MLLAGDEMGRSQRGNNNAYSQDGEISWLNWDLISEDREFLAFTCHVIALRKEHPAFRRRTFFQRHRQCEGEKSILWFNPEGLEMSDDEWNQGFARCLGMYLAGDAIGEVGERGDPIRDADFLLLINAHHEEIPFQIPGFHGRMRWQVALDTGSASLGDDCKRYACGSIVPLQGRSLVLLQQASSAPS